MIPTEYPERVSVQFSREPRDSALRLRSFATNPSLAHNPRMTFKLKNTVVDSYCSTTHDVKVRAW